MAKSNNIQMRLVPLLFHKLSAMLMAGVSLEAALLDLERQRGGKGFNEIVSKLRDSTQRGNPLSASMEAFPHVFLPMHTSIIQAAENTGKLPETLAQIADSIDGQTRLRRKVIRAMIYPIVVICIAIIIVTLMLIFVLPAFGDMYVGFDAELPRPTQLLLDLRDAITKYGLYIVLGIGVSVIVLKLLKATLLGKVVSDWLKLHYPIAGDLNRKIATVRFAKTYAQLLSSGVPILNALKLASGATGNSITEQVMLNALQKVKGGEPLSSAMESQKIFPELLRDMLQSGEKTGKTDEMMYNLARLYEEEVSTTVDGLTILIQPFLIVVIGIIIGGMIIAILMPWFQLPSIVSM